MVTLIKETRDKVLADYDEGADVLYLTYGMPRPGYGDSADDGVILRYSESDDTPIGATIVGYKSLQWNVHKDALARDVSRHLGIEPFEIIRLLDGIGA